MKKKILRVLGFLTKCVIVYFLIKVGVKFYDTTRPAYDQNILVWLLLYIPIFTGYETIIATIFNRK